MAKRTTHPTARETPQDGVERVVDIDVEDEMRSAFLEYSYTASSTPVPCPMRATGSSPCSAASCSGMSELGLRLTGPREVQPGR